MALYLMMCGIALLAVVLVAFLLFILRKESDKEEAIAVPVVVDFNTPAAPLVKPIPVEEIIAEQGNGALEQGAYQKRISDLEEELKQVSDKAVSQAQEALSMIDQLKKQNDDLEAQKQELSRDVEVKVSEASSHVAQLRVENNALQVQLEKTHAKNAALEEELGALKSQLDIEIRRATDQIQETVKEKDEAVAEALKFEMAKLTAQEEALRQSMRDLEAANVKLKEINGDLSEKNEVLIYELTKYRAQSSGLERICNEYKNRLSQLPVSSRGVTDLISQ